MRARGFVCSIVLLGSGVLAACGSGDGGSGGGGTGGGGTGGAAGATGGGGSGGTSATGGSGGSGATGGSGGCTTVYYKDGDGDTFGNPAESVSACSPPAGYVSDKTDCDDTSSSTYPGATEACNAKDDDCDTSKDNGFACVQGSSISCTTSCGTQGTGTCTNACAAPTGTDCTPPADTCNGVDDNCDGKADYGLIKSSAKTQLAYQLNPNLVWQKVVPHADGTFTLLYVRDDTYAVSAQKVSATGQPTGNPVTVVSASSYGNLLRSIDGADIGGRLWVAWASASGQPYLAAYNTSTYAVANAAKAYGSPAASMVRLTAPGGLVHLIWVRSASNVTYYERAELTPPASGAALPAAVVKTYVSGGLPVVAFGATHGSNTLAALVASNGVLELYNDNGSTANVNYTQIASVTGNIRYPSVATTPSGAIAVAWAEYPTSGTPSVKLAYLSNFYATKVVKTIDTQAPYFATGQNERFERKTDLAHIPGPGYFLLATNTMNPGGTFSTTYLKSFVVYPTNPLDQSSVPLGFTSNTELSGPNYEVTLGPLQAGALLAYDHEYGSKLSGQLIGCY